ncbi:MAG: hypothetical protein NTX48_22730, partial [Planctomycetales bacterium]|nr:hypothetical protein [Planctomycetales bacterium]
SKTGPCYTQIAVCATQVTAHPYIFTEKPIPNDSRFQLNTHFPTRTSYRDRNITNVERSIKNGNKKRLQLLSKLKPLWNEHPQINKNRRTETSP